jgi:hypothetical protein
LPLIESEAGFVRLSGSPDLASIVIRQQTATMLKSVQQDFIGQVQILGTQIR